MNSASPIYPKDGTQEHRLRMALLDQDGGWVNGNYFLRSLYLSEYRRAIWNLQNRFHWKVELSDFTDTHGFKSYRVMREVRQLAIFG